MKKKYMAPQVEMLKMENVTLFAASMGSDATTGIGFGGSAKDNGIDEADVNEGGNWELW